MALSSPRTASTWRNVVRSNGGSASRGGAVRRQGQSGPPRLGHPASGTRGVHRDVLLGTRRREAHRQNGAAGKGRWTLSATTVPATAAAPRPVLTFADASSRTP